MKRPPASLRPNGSLALIATMMALCFCISCANSNPPAQARSAFYTDPATLDFSQNPELLERILSGPHGYFRFTNILFSNEVCRRLGRSLRGMPSFNLHGDAHLEQYAVTDLGRGLTDFDDSSTGPAVIDIMRFGVSIHLTCRNRGWEDATPGLFDQFLSGYRNALRKPDSKPDEPALVTRLRSKFKFDRKKYFKWIDGLMQEMPAAEKSGVIAALKPYIEAMYAENPDLPDDFFEVVGMGYLRMGIGSALDLKYLLRVRGDSPKPDDDLVLEIKQVRDLTGIECITTAREADPFRVLVGQARIAYEPYQYLGYIRYKELTFWVHAWVDNYEEYAIGKTAQSVGELAEVAYDIGVQLGRGHTNQIAAPLDAQLRREQLKYLGKNEVKIKTLCVELADEIVVAWRRFAKDVQMLN